MLAVLVEEASAVRQRDLPERGHSVVEQRDRHRAVVVELESGGEADVGDALHGAVGVELVVAVFRRKRVVEGADDGSPVATRIDAELVEADADPLVEADEVRSLRFDFFETDRHGRPLSALLHRIRGVAEMVRIVHVPSMWTMTCSTLS